jgi:hypothetical protein
MPFPENIVVNATSAQDSSFIFKRAEESMKID